MRSLKSLFKSNSHVWLFCGSEESRIRFLAQAESEGFLALNGQRPTELSPNRFYGINPEMTLGYVSGMIWFLSAKAPNCAISTTTSKPIINPLRVDYEKYIDGADDFVIKE